MVMMTMLKLTLMVCVLALPAAAQAGSNEGRTEEAKQVFATIARWADAVRARDAKTLDLLFEETLIVTAADGTTRNRAQELAILGPNDKLKIVSIANEDIVVRLFGETAVATGLTRMQFDNSGKESRTAFRFTAVFVRNDGRWQLTALHAGSPIRSATK